jgi:hypothetical protein
MARAFIIRPFGKKKDSSGKEVDFDHIHEFLIGPALELAGLGGGTTGEIIDAGNIREDMFALILEADLVVCDVTFHNANVFYELGIRHAFRKKRTLLIKGRPTADGTPFDLLTDRYLPYEVDNPAAARDDLVEMINASLKSERETDSPIFQMLPNLSEADWSEVLSVPLDFREEVDRAQAAKSKGWLRLIASEVRNRRFQWEGLKLVGNAQWKLKDWDGAQESWEAIREIHPEDIEANFALANIYERQYRTERRPDLLESSNHAIGRVLASDRLDRDRKAEALALQGRNEKTRWRLEFDNLDSTEDRRRAAMNRALIRSYERYREAYFQDLNHFYSGLAALQMGTVLFDLSNGDEWYDAFDSDEQADSRKKSLEAEIADLRTVVKLSIDVALDHMPPNDPGRLWAEVSRADVLFLTSEKRTQRVVNAYANAIPSNEPFAWDSARGQLNLFAKLGVREALARKVFEAIDGRFKVPQKEKPVHLIVFGGHLIDLPDRDKPRFPAGSETRAKELLMEEVKRVIDGQQDFVGLASGAPGADILAHEICEELEIPSTICLPMPAEEYSRRIFEELDDWRTRFLNLLQIHKKLELSDSEGLPRWLHGSGVDPWERGNRWVMQMALTWGAERTTLIALWDGEKAHGATGGTTQLVQLARDAGTVEVLIVDSKQLI